MKWCRWCTQSPPQPVLHFGVVVDGGAVECPICLETDDRQVCALPCLHKFHTECIREWFKRRYTCPMCNHAFGIAPTSK